MQGVLSYEERLQRAREEARSARLKLDSTVKELQFWRARAEELQGRLQMYEGRKGTEDREIGCSGKDSDAGVRDVSPVSSRCEVREGVEVHGVGDKAEAIEGEEGNVEHVCGEEEMAYVLKEDKVGWRTLQEMKERRSRARLVKGRTCVPMGKVVRSLLWTAPQIW